MAIDCGFTMTTKAEDGNGNGLAPQMEHQLKVIKDFGIVYSDVLRCTWPAVGPDVHGKPVKIHAIVLSNTCTDELPRDRVLITILAEQLHNKICFLFLCWTNREQDSLGKIRFLFNIKLTKANEVRQTIFIFFFNRIPSRFKIPLPPHCLHW